MSIQLVDETAADVPVRDTDSKLAVIKAIQDVSMSPAPPKNLKTVTTKEKDVKVRQRVGHLSREDLEDRFLRLHDDHRLLKEYAHKQENKIKRMGTKLLRLVSERKSGGTRASAAGTQWLGRDLATEASVEELQDKVRELERQNTALRHRLTASTRQLQMQGSCRHCPYGNIMARVDSGLRGHGRESSVPQMAKRGMRVQGPEVRSTRTAPARYGEHQLGEAARAEIERLAQLVQSQTFRMAELEQASSSTKDAVVPNITWEVDQQVEEHRNTIQENVVKIRLQKQLWEKDSALRLVKEEFLQLQEAYEGQLHEKQETLRIAHDALLAEVEDLSSQLKAEQMKTMTLDSQKESMSMLQQSVEEFQGRVGDLEKERDILKDNYDTLLKSTLDMESQRSWKCLEEPLPGEITCLEGELKSEILAKSELQDKLSLEAGRNEELQKEINWMHLQLLEQKQEALLLQGKVGAILSSTQTKPELSNIPNKLQSQIADQLWRLSLPLAAWEERMETLKKTEEKSMVEKEDSTWRDNFEMKFHKVEEARMVNPKKNTHDMESAQMETHMKKHHEMEVGRIEPLVKTGQEVQDRHTESPIKKLQELDAEHAETILELEKTRDMLILQHKINKDYQEELEAVMVKAELEKKHQEEKELKAAQLLDLQGARIQRLEGQLKDIAYGTWHPSFKSSLAQNDHDVTDEVPPLNRGENLFELHIQQAHLTPEALRHVGDPQPATFCTYSFYDFETHATPVMSGPHPVFNFTSQYAVRLDEPFFEYLQDASARLDLHLAEATDHRILAACWLRFGQVLESGDCVHGTAELNGSNGENFGMLEYWMRLRFPIPQTLQLNRERTKALGYISANVQSQWGAPHRQTKRDQALAFTDQEGQRNELVVRLAGCSRVQSRWLGSQPSPYAIYRFFDFPDYNTPTVPCSNNPHFGDHITFPVSMNADLDRYLRFESLWVYVFDDEDSEPGCYLGKAQVPLLSLAHGRAIKGDFVLNDFKGNPNGSINLSLEWKISYKFPAVSAPEGRIRDDQINQRSLDTFIEWEKGLLHQESGLKTKAPAQGYRGSADLQSSYKLNGTLPPKVRKVTIYEKKSHELQNRKQSQAVSLSRKLTENQKSEVHPKKARVSKAREAAGEAMVESTKLHEQGVANRAFHRMVPGSGPQITNISHNKNERQPLEKPRGENVKGVVLVKSQLKEKEHKQEEEVEVLSEREVEEEHSEVEDTESIPQAKGIGYKKAESADMGRVSHQSSEESESLSTDSDDVIVVARPWKVPKPMSERIRIEIGSLSLDPHSEVAEDSRVQRVYVEYRFLDLPLEETETPVSLRKPRPGEEIHFNFSKEIHLDRSENGDRRDILYGMLEGLAGGGEEARLRFTVVSDPLNELEDECEEVGYAYLDLQQILVTGCDVMEHHLNIFNVPEQQAVIGTLTVSIEAVEALRDIYWERRDPQVS